MMFLAQGYYLESRHHGYQFVGSGVVILKRFNMEGSVLCAWIVCEGQFLHLEHKNKGSVLQKCPSAVFLSFRY